MNTRCEGQDRGVGGAFRRCQKPATWHFDAHATDAKGQPITWNLCDKHKWAAQPWATQFGDRKWTRIEVEG